MNEFTHIDKNGRAQMVDVGDKKCQKRYARASGVIYLSNKTLALIKDNQIKKGDVLTVAQIAGIQAAKQTPMMIPLCHMLILDKVEVTFDFIADGIVAKSLVKCIGRTGVEMEALVAVNAALLTIYDMCKAVDKQMQIGDIKLVEKVKEDVK
jgi:cyclic pyranopterin monophosphate synthase